MALDLPFLQELRRRNHPAAKWFSLGDRIFYLGLLPGIMAVPCTVMGLLGGLMGYGWLGLIVSVGIIIAGCILVPLGMAIKKSARNKAAKDGIVAKDAFNQAQVTK
jgi:hypothetical protein